MQARSSAFGWPVLTPLMMLAILRVVYLFIFRLHVPVVIVPLRVVQIFQGCSIPDDQRKRSVTGHFPSVASQAVLSHTVFPSTSPLRRPFCSAR